MLSQQQNSEVVAQFLDDFLTDTHSLLTATEGSTGTVTITGKSGGWLSIATAATSADYSLASTAKFVEMLAGKPVVIEFRLQCTEGTLGNAEIVVGLSDILTTGFLSATGTPPTNFNGAVFFKAKTSQVWQFCTSKGAVQTINPNVGAFTPGVPQVLGFKFDPDSNGTTGQIKPFVNGIQVGYSGSPQQVNLWASLAAPMAMIAGIKAGDGTVETLLVDYIGADIYR